MKKCSVLIAICLSLIVAVPAAFAVFCYNRPMEEQSFGYFLTENPNYSHSITNPT